MHTQPDPADDLSEVEQLLSARLPAVDGLNADAMLFAAGRAYRSWPGRVVWPAITAGLAALSIFLGIWMAIERAGRQELARQIREFAPTSVPLLAPETFPTEPVPPEEWAPDSYLAARPALEKGLDAWPARTGRTDDRAEPSQPSTLHVRGFDGLLAQ